MLNSKSVGTKVSYWTFSGNVFSNSRRIGRKWKRSLWVIQRGELLRGLPLRAKGRAQETNRLRRVREAVANSLARRGHRSERLRGIRQHRGPVGTTRTSKKALRLRSKPNANLSLMRSGLLSVSSYIMMMFSYISAKRCSQRVPTEEPFLIKPQTILAWTPKRKKW